jgi:rifampicin phosphotransferase
MSTQGPRLIPLERSEGDEVGGKAAGLAKLIRMGLRVPEGFVIVGATPGHLPEGLVDEACAKLGDAALAVRSSARGEDGAETSFAGQYETVLDVRGTQAVREAVEHCLRSAHGGRADAYRDGLSASGEVRMSVVVQRMVDATAAGVLFTVDPVSGARDRVVVNAVAGLGEALVSGQRAADQFVLSRDGTLLESQVQGPTPAIDAAMLQALLSDALAAEAKLGHPVDMEWAIAADGSPYWLQARPITTLDAPDLNELDSTLPQPNCVLTTYNVSEVMPGAATPLTSSVLGRRLDSIMNELYVRCGVSPALLAGRPLVLNFYGHQFINMNAMYFLGTQVLGMSKEETDHTLAGCVLPDVEQEPSAPFHQRLLNTVRYVRLLFQARERLDAFTHRTADFRWSPGQDMATVYRWLDESVEVVREAFAIHVHTSTLSSALLSLLLRVLSGGKRPEAQHNADAAALLAHSSTGATDAHVSTISLGMAEAMDKVMAALQADAEASARFVALGQDEALAWLREQAPEPIRTAFAHYLRDHGHRCIREMELHVRDWQEDPRPLVLNLQRAASVPRTAPAAQKKDATQEVLARLSFGARGFLGWLLPKAREAVVLRERSKSLSVRHTRQLRYGYLEIARQLVELGRLPDEDLVFFVTHEELGRLLSGEERAVVRRAQHRRRLHPQKMALEFPRVIVGKPVPLAPGGEAGDAGAVMRGTPVSRGMVVGPARVARTPEEAVEMREGEILIVPYTDVGWAPYFCRAAGLATEIGSPLSHGAVVAREYGLPAVVNLPGATKRFKTGDRVRLDGNTGELHRLG